MDWVHREGEAAVDKAEAQEVPSGGKALVASQRRAWTCNSSEHQTNTAVLEQGWKETEVPEKENIQKIVTELLRHLALGFRNTDGSCSPEVYQYL